MKDTVFGYVRNIQRFLPTNNAFYTIPEVVANIIILYFTQNEGFYRCGYEMVISSDNVTNDILTMEHGSKWNTGYGSVIIHCNPKNHKIYEWILKINAHQFGIGIVPKTKKLDFNHLDNFAFGVDKTGPNYGYRNCTGTVKQFCNGCNALRGCKSFLISFKRNQIVRLILNSKKKSVEVFINGESIRPFDNIQDGKYRLAVSIIGEGHKAQIIDFTITYQ